MSRRDQLFVVLLLVGILVVAAAFVADGFDWMELAGGLVAGVGATVIVIVLARAFDASGRPRG